MLQYLHSDADGVEYYFDDDSRDIVIRDSRTIMDHVRECKVPWSILKSKVEDIIGFG